VSSSHPGAEPGGGPEADVLAALAPPGRPLLDPCQLAERTGRAPAEVTEVLHRLTERGLVEQRLPLSWRPARYRALR
jgi:DNA-binding IclR family transcriptional regulator